MMHCIPIIEEIAFLIDKETAAYTHLAQDKADGTIPSEIQNALNDGTFAEKSKMTTFGICIVISQLPRKFSNVVIVQDLKAKSTPFFLKKAFMPSAKHFLTNGLSLFRQQKKRSYLRPHIPPPKNWPKSFARFFLKSVLSFQRILVFGRTLSKSVARYFADTTADSIPIWI